MGYAGPCAKDGGILVHLDRLDAGGKEVAVRMVSERDGAAARLVQTGSEDGLRSAEYGNGKIAVT
jgi:hypothetical protein